MELAYGQEYRTEAKRLRPEIGMTMTWMSFENNYAQICLDHAKYLSQIKSDLPEVKQFLELECNLAKNGILPVCAEIGYIQNDIDYSHTYISVLIDKKFAPMVEDMIANFEELHIYMTDAEWEITQRKKELENYDTAARKSLCVTLDPAASYYNYLLLRYPFNYLLNMESAAADYCINETFHLQIAPRVPGVKTTYIYTFMSVLLNKIRSYS